MGEAIEPQTGAAVTACEVALVGVLQLSNARDAVFRELRLQSRTRTADHADRLVAQKRDRLAGADDGKAARLVEFARKLGEEFVAGETDGDGDADLMLDAPGERGHRFGRAVPCRRSVPERSR